jgi:hypothetical protein
VITHLFGCYELGTVMMVALPLKLPKNCNEVSLVTIYMDLMVVTSVHHLEDCFLCRGVERNPWAAASLHDAVHFAFG